MKIVRPPPRTSYEVSKVRARSIIRPGLSQPSRETGDSRYA